MQTFTAQDISCFRGVCETMEDLLVRAPVYDRGEWQAQKNLPPEQRTRELTQVVLNMRMDPTIDRVQQFVEPNLPWAEDHFQERVSGVPHNPPPSVKWWPYAQSGHAAHTNDARFSHTYPERFWPRAIMPQYGIRFRPGDLNDVVQVLKNNERSRQAFLPVWFPEDIAAAVEGQRVPCTIGYHFLVTDDGLNITYQIRSCDYTRHFRDDVYMAIRLAQWMSDALSFYDLGLAKLKLGWLQMVIGSFHIFDGDVGALNYKRNHRGAATSARLMEALG